MPGEYAVYMHRLARRDMSVALVRGGRLHPREVDTLAGLITDFHATTSVAGTSSSDGAFSGTQHMLKDCAAGVIALGHVSLGMATTISLPRQYTVRLEETLASHRRSRHTHECRDGLHPSNIVLIDGQPTPFDYLEFSPSLRWANTMYDIALLSMDLLAAGLDGLACQLTSRYLERYGDHGGLAVPPFYIAMRTFVRVHILLEHVYQLGGAPDEAANLRDETSHMPALSRHLFCRNNAYIPLIRGLSGSGKSTRAVQLAQAGGMVRVRSDVKYRHRWHIHAVDRYLSRVAGHTYRRPAVICKLSTDADLPVITDATSLTEHQRRHFFSLSRRLGTAAAIVDCVVNVDTLCMHIRSHMRDGCDVSEADLRVPDVQIAAQEPFNAGERAHVIPGEVSKMVPYIKSRGQ